MPLWSKNPPAAFVPQHLEAIPCRRKVPHPLSFRRVHISAEPLPGVKQRADDGRERSTSPRFVLRNPLDPTDLGSLVC